MNRGDGRFRRRLRVGGGSRRAEGRRRDTGSRETCIVVLRGVVSVSAGGALGQNAWREIGERNSVFDERSPYAVYVSSGESVSRVTLPVPSALTA